MVNKGWVALAVKLVFHSLFGKLWLENLELPELYLVQMEKKQILVVDKVFLPISCIFSNQEARIRYDSGRYWNKQNKDHKNDKVICIQ